MTALKPIENRRVRGVASERYPLNAKCAHPECNEPTADPHHCFPRSAIGNDSWFVEIRVMGNGDDILFVMPHVTGLCRAHHDAVEEHDAWIKLENGVFVWYDRHDGGHTSDGDPEPSTWEAVGPLNPQPGSQEGKPKRKKFKGEARRQRKTISMKVPQDEQEDGAGLFEDALLRVEAILGYDPPRPAYYTLMDALNYVSLNEGGKEDDSSE